MKNRDIATECSRMVIYNKVGGKSLVLIFEMLATKRFK